LDTLNKILVWATFRFELFRELFNHRVLTLLEITNHEPGAMSDSTR